MPVETYLQRDTYSRVKRVTSADVPGGDINFAVPAAGQPWIVTVPTGVYWRFVMGCGTLTTGATAANRYVGFQYVDPTVSPALLWNQSTHTTAQTASGKAFPQYHARGPVGFFTTPVVQALNYYQYMLGLPSMWLPPGFQLKDLTLGIQSTDQWSGLAFWFEEIDDPSPGSLVSFTMSHA